MTALGQAPVTIGIDVGGTTTRIVAFGADGGELSRQAMATPRGGERLTGALADAVDGLAGGHLRVLHVGVGVPGRVTDRSNVAMALNVGIDTGYDLGRALGDRLGVPVVVENDVNAAASGVFDHLGDGGDLAYLSIGTGFAAGLVVGGEVVRGATGTAGEIGHLPVPGNDTPCACGQRGCIEAIVAGSVLADAAAALGVGTDTAALWDAASGGNAEAARMVEGVLDVLAWVCHLAVVTLDVEHVVIGGGVSDLGDRLIEPIKVRLRRSEAASPLLAGIAPSGRLGLAPQGIEIGALGADRLARRWLAVGA